MLHSLWPRDLEERKIYPRIDKSNVYHFNTPDWQVSYIKAVDASLLIEFGRIERKASKEPAKKPKVWDFFSGNSSSGEDHGAHSQ